MNTYTTTILLEMLIGGAWAIAITISLIGIGSILDRKNEQPLWIKAVLGGATYTGIAGWLDCLHIGNLTNLTIVWLIGLIFFLLWCFCSENKTSIKEKINSFKGWKTLIFFLVVLGLISFFSFNNLYQANWDDSCGYVPPCHELMTNGSSWAPLSLRRACALGGEFPLQSLGMLWGGDKHWALYECSVPLLILGILLSKNIKSLGILLSSLLLIIPENNSSSAPSFAVMLACLALWYCRWNTAHIAIIIGYTLSLRVLSLPFIGLVLIFKIIEEIKENKKLTHPIIKGLAKDTIKYLFLIGATIVLYLVPFLINNYAQFKTPCILLGSGTINPEYLHGSYGIQSIPMGITLLFFGATNLIILLATICYNKNTRVIGIIASISFLFIVATMTKFGVGEWTRYAWPFLTASLLIFCLTTKNRLNGLLICAVCISYPLINITKKLENINSKEGERFNNLVFDSYEKIQNNTLEGTTLAVMTQEVYGFDFKRNKILNLDYFPSIGNFPTETNPEKAKAAWVDWGKKNKADYLIHVDFDSMCKGQSWYDLYTKPKGENIQLPFYLETWNPQKKKMLDSIKSAESLLHKEKVCGYIIVNLND